MLARSIRVSASFCASSMVTPPTSWGGASTFTTPSARRRLPRKRSWSVSVQPRRRHSLGNLALVAAAAILFSTVASQVGRAGNLAGGLDGHQAYEKAVGAGMRQADPATRARPLVIRIARDLSRPSSPVSLPVVRLGKALNLPGDETQRVFELLNVAYAALLAVLLCTLLDFYGASIPVKAVVVL